MWWVLAFLGCSTPQVEGNLSHGEKKDGGTPAEEVVLTKVRLALNWYPEPEFGGFYEGLLGGQYAAAGFDVEIIPGGPGAPTLELLTAGNVEAAITAADDLLIKRSKGVKAVGVWPAFQNTPLGLMVHADHPAQGYGDFASLPGTQVAIEVGGAFQGFLWGTFGWEGKIEAVPYGGSVGPFVVDPKAVTQGYVTSEPCVARSQGVEIRFLGASESGWNPYGSLLALPDPVPTWGPAFVEATHTAWTAYMASPDRANAEISRTNDQMKPELMACITEAQKPFVHGTDGMGAMTEARWITMAEQLVALELLPAGATAEGAWMNRNATEEPPG